MPSYLEIALRAATIAALPDGEKTSDSNLPGVLAEEPRPFARSMTKKTRPGQSERKMACGSPSCAGCYYVGDGKKIHPPRCGEEYRKWHERSIAATSLICSLIPCVMVTAPVLTFERLTA